MKKRRIEILNSLINFDKNLSMIRDELKDVTWDSDHEYVLLKRSDLVEILNKFIDEKIGSNQIEEWANLLECREDISFEKHFEEILTDVVFELANPDLTGSLTKDRSKSLIKKLSC